MTYNIHIKTNPPSPREIHSHLKSSAKKRNIPFDLSVYDVCNISLPVTCPILNIPLHWYQGINAQDDSYSFDRICSASGYTFDNIQVLSMKANRAKNNLSESELKLFAMYFK